MEARRFYLDTQRRQFVASPDSTLPASDSLFFDEDVESIALFFLKPTGSFTEPYEYVDYSANAVKFAVGTTTPAALQVTWSAITSAVTATITSLVTGGSGSNEQQRVTLSPKPVSGSWALQFPARNVTVSSVAANLFTAADHGLYAGQSVGLTSFSLTNSAVANGSSYYVIRNSKDTFSLAATATSTTALTAAVTSGGGTVEVPALTTGQLAYNASPSDVQAAIAALGLVVSGVPQIIVTGSAGSEYVITYANGSANRDYANVTVVGSNLLGPVGLQANVSFATSEIAALLAAGTTSARLEIEVSDGTIRQTYQTACTLANDILTSSSPTPVPTGITSFLLKSADNSTWAISIDNDGIITAAKQ